MKPLALIVARSRNGVIGRNGDLPWHYAEDLKFFKRTTLDHAIVMGRVCYQSIGRALPRRRNIVISRNPSFEATGCEVVPSLDDALAAARITDDMPYVIGGAQIYALALPLTTRMVITEVNRDVEGDTFFPAFDESAWREIERTDALDGELTFRVLERL